ncbi:MAG: hypothetical protein AMS26_14475 [Bacteroides sp. SM23_62]|nr:MAG: hypothetical protein AMS26_14475 [Bacteroides sp. SM23_62]
MAILKLIGETGPPLSFNADPGANLLDVLTRNGIEIYAPCGGNGTCGKCRIRTRNQGIVLACQHTITGDEEIILPSALEASILEFQHNHTFKYPVNPGECTQLSESPYGVAIDIGTTTIVLYFFDFSRESLVYISSILNPQQKYGADVISRINHCIQDAGGLATLHSELIRAINHQIRRFLSEHGLEEKDIVKVTFTGNTTMLHFLLKEDARSIAFAPYQPGFTQEQHRTGAELELASHNHAFIKVLPSISGYVGADIVAGLAALKPEDQIKTYLFIDLGTNGELALVTPDRHLCCATAAGPAFEAANISCGMAAVKGAISGYTEKGYQTIADVPPLGLCGSGLMDVISVLLDAGSISPTGELEQDFVIAPAADSGSGEAIRLTPADVRELQLAKAAVAAGISILLKSAGIDAASVDAVYLAGGFGNYIKKESAIRTGLLDQSFFEKIFPIGNASGTGALVALKSADFDSRVNSVLEQMQYIELSSDPDFITEYAMNMSF